jgi:hypothetical protein
MLRMLPWYFLYIFNVRACMHASVRTVIRRINGHVNVTGTIFTEVCLCVFIQAFNGPCSRNRPNKLCEYRAHLVHSAAAPPASAAVSLSRSSS